MITTPSDSTTPTITGRFGSTTNSSNSWFKNPSGRFMTRNLNQHMIQKSLLRQVVSGQRKLQATHDSNIPAKAGRSWSTKNLKQHMIQTFSGRFMTKNLKQHMIQISLLRQVVSGQRKTSSNSWFKNLSGRLMTRNLKQLMIQTSLPRQVAFGQRNTSSNSWFKNPCQGKSFLVNKKPQATHDSKIPAKTGRFWSTKYLKQPMRPPMIHTSSTNLSIEHLSNDPLNWEILENGFRSVLYTESTKRGIAPH